MTTILEAVLSLRPNADCYVIGESYAGIQWNDQQQTKPTQEEVDAEIVRIESNIAANEYKVRRAAEYPPVVDYLDGVVKNDQAQIQAYVAACNAVKAKYPKPAPKPVDGKTYRFDSGQQTWVEVYVGNS